MIKYDNSMIKSTAQAPSNIAFVKYWGKADDNLRIPSNPSISMNLDKLHTITTVNFGREYNQDMIIIDSKKRNVTGSSRIIKHIDRIRKLAKVRLRAKVVSINSFPSSTGLSSSASGFAALTLAAAAALDLKLSEQELSSLSRLGSGSACRSIPDGFVLWEKGNSHASSSARSIFDHKWWDIVDLVTIVDFSKKSVSTTQAQKHASTSPFFLKRISVINKKIKDLIKFIKARNFTKFGELIEREALQLHALIMTQKPPHVFWKTETLTLMQKVVDLRKKGIEAYYTLNTGHNVHIICESENMEKIYRELKKYEFVKDIIVNHPAPGAKLINNHLF